MLFYRTFMSAIFWVDDTRYPTVEHAYQASKTLNKDERMAIVRAKHAGDAKRLGKNLTLRPGWEDIKVAVMLKLLRQKFGYGISKGGQIHPDELSIKLILTGDKDLVEGNNWGDEFWGKALVRPSVYEGKN